MKLQGPALVYLNAVCGTVFIASTAFKFSSYIVALFFLGLSLWFLVCSYLVERYELKRPGHKHHTGTASMHGVDQVAEGGLFVLNIIAILALWIPPLASWLESFGGYTTVALVVALFFLILGRDFMKLGQELARRMFWKARMG